MIGRSSVADPAAAKDRMKRCAFCGAAALRPFKLGAYHPRRPAHGPFDLYRCERCRSIITDPPVTPDALDAFYHGEYESGLPSELLRAREAAPLNAFYAKSLQRALRFGNRRAGLAWIEVGAGTGLLARRFGTTFPDSRGTAVDFHDRPPALRDVSNVKWIRGDLNANALDVLDPADVVIALAVFEHVISVERFLESLVDLVNPGGSLYLVCPDAGSPMFRVTGTRWPYWSPGEHLNIPTIAGAKAIVERVVRERGRRLFEARIASVTMPYPLRYLAAFLRLPLLPLILPTWSVPVPAGALEILARIE